MRKALSQIGRRLSFSNAISLVALFVALGGTSYAVATGSIDSREIKNNSVRSGDVRNNSLRSRDVRNFSLLAKDFKAGQLPAGPAGQAGLGGPAGARGPQGLRGLPGLDGDDGDDGFTGIEVVPASSAFDSTSPKSATATCPAGKDPITGSTEIASNTIEPLAEITDRRSGANAGDPLGDAWIGGGAETSATAGNWLVNAEVVCAVIQP